MADKPIMLSEKAKATVATLVAQARETQRVLNTYMAGVREALEVPEGWVLDYDAPEKGFVAAPEQAVQE